MNSSKKTILILGIIALALCYWLFTRPIGLFSGQKEEAKDSAQNIVVQVGSQAPDVTVQMEDKNLKKLSTFKGKTILLNFWATWCVPCVKEMPSLEKFAEQEKDHGIEVIAISVDDGWDKIHKLFKSINLKPVDKSVMHILRDEDGSAANTFHTNQFPETYLITRDFVIRKKYVGSMDWMSSARIREVEEVNK